MEVDEVSNEGDTTPFLGEDMVMTIYGVHPLLGVCHVSNPSLGTLACCGWGCRDAGM
jgi:hypothetical protein